MGRAATRTHWCAAAPRRSVGRAANVCGPARAHAALANQHFGARPEADAATAAMQRSAATTYVAPHGNTGGASTTATATATVTTTTTTGSVLGSARAPTLAPAHGGAAAYDAPAFGDHGPGLFDGTRPRTLLDLARDTSAPNSGNAGAVLQERVAIFDNLALQVEYLMKQVGVSVPPATNYSNAARIRAQIGARN